MFDNNYSPKVRMEKGEKERGNRRQRSGRGSIRGEMQLKKTAAHFEGLCCTNTHTQEHTHLSQHLSVIH